MVENEYVPTQYSGFIGGGVQAELVFMTKMATGSITICLIKVNENYFVTLYEKNREF